MAHVPVSQITTTVLESQYCWGWKEPLEIIYPKIQFQGKSSRAGCLGYCLAFENFQEWRPYNPSGLHAPVLDPHSKMFKCKCSYFNFCHCPVFFHWKPPSRVWLHLFKSSHHIFINISLHSPHTTFLCSRPNEPCSLSFSSNDRYFNSPGVWHFLLLTYMRFLPAHFTSLSRFLWMVAQLSGLSTTPLSFFIICKLAEIPPSISWMNLYGTWYPHESITVYNWSPVGLHAVYNNPLSLPVQPDFSPTHSPLNTVHTKLDIYL